MEISIKTECWNKEKTPLSAIFDEVIKSLNNLNEGQVLIIEGLTDKMFMEYSLNILGYIVANDWKNLQLIAKDGIIHVAFACRSDR